MQATSSDGQTVPEGTSGEEKAGVPGASASVEEATTPSEASSDLVEVVVGLAAARDKALMAGDTEGLAATTVVGSPAQQADAQLVQELVEVGEEVTYMKTSVSQVVEVEPPASAVARWPGARAVQVSQSQAPSRRSGGNGERTVPAQTARQVVLVLVPQPWRVAEVYEP